MIRREKPDLVFLDIQIPELDGFGVVEALGKDDPPVIVFVTAHDRFALKAFEVHAVDYLLKPFDRQRFETALKHAIEQVRRRDRPDLVARQTAALAELQPPGPPLQRLAIKNSGRVVFVNLGDIDWIEAAHNYVELHVSKQSHLLRETMTAIEARLPADKFVRISRSVIVNLDRVKELHPMFHGEYTVVLHNGEKLTLSRRYRDKLPRFGIS
jgi:two-component system LytT family response regulator